MLDNCPVCGTNLIEKLQGGYDCPRCGRFCMSDSTTSLLPCLFDVRKEGDYEEKGPILSHAIRKMQKAAKEGGYRPNIESRLIKEIIKKPLPKPAEQKDVFIRWVGDSIKVGGDYVRVNKYSIQAIIGARKDSEFTFIFEYLETKGLVKGKKTAGLINVLMDVTLSYDGWEYYEELKRGESESRKAFMAMEYGDEELDKIVDDHFKQAVIDTGFELYRLDEHPRAGFIDDHLRIEIRNSRFLIADLTHENNGAYWEAGYAEGLRKPVIYTCKKEKFDKDKPHFDTNHHLTVIWDAKEIKNAVDTLKATIRATLPSEAKLSDD